MISTTACGDIHMHYSTLLAVLVVLVVLVVLAVLILLAVLVVS